MKAPPVMDQRPCHGCGMHRQVRQYRRRWWLCIDGPNKCYRHRRRVVLVLEASQKGRGD